MQGKYKDFITKNETLYSLLLPFLKVIRKNNKAALYDYLFSSVVGGNVRVTVENIPGVYEIDARSHILKRIMVTKEYEPEIVEHILENLDKGKDAINVGANIGLFTSLLSNSINSNCKVLAIEPTSSAFSLLEENIKCNCRKDQVILFKGVAADKEGTYKVNVIIGNEEYSSMGALVHSSTTGKCSSSLEVKGETIDYLVEKYDLKPGIMVIDTEGAEYSVLKGSHNTLKKFRPVIISEIDDGLLMEQKSSSKRIFELLKQCEYKVFNAKNKDEIRDPFVGNIIALPYFTIKNSTDHFEVIDRIKKTSIKKIENDII